MSSMRIRASVPVYQQTYVTYIKQQISKRLKETRRKMHSCL